MTSEEHELERVFQFLGSSFHQDWTLDYGSWEEAVDFYTTGQSPERRTQLLRDLDRFIERVERCAPAEQEKLLDRVGLEYRPTRITVVEWLRAVRERIA